MAVNLKEIIAPSFYEVHRMMKEHQKTHYWLGGGRGSTKSSFISIEIILGMMKNPNANSVALRKVEKNLADSVFNQLVWAIDILGVTQYWKIKKSPLEIEYLPTGQKILFRGADDPKKIKSTKFVKGYCQYIWYEEVDEFNGMEEIRMINQSLMRGGDDFQAMYSYNPPKSINNWVNQVHLDVREDTLYHKSDYRTVPRHWLGEQFIIEAEHLKDYKPEAYEHEYLGVPTGTGGNVFTNIKIRPITDEEISHFSQIRKGLDYGYAVDPFAWVQIEYDKTRRRIFIFDQIYRTGMSNTMATEEIKKKQVSNGWNIGDSAEPKSIAEMLNLGLRIKGAKKGPDSVEYGIKWLQMLDEIVIDSTRCPDVAREFINYEYEQDKYGNFKSIYPDKDNHTIDATRYALEDDTKKPTMTLSNNQFINIPTM